VQMIVNKSECCLSVCGLEIIPEYNALWDWEDESVSDVSAAIAC